MKLPRGDEDLPQNTAGAGEEVRFPAASPPVSSPSPPLTNLKLPWPPVVEPISTLARSFSRLPVELRLKIWFCAAEPRVIIIDDLIHIPKAYPLPSVAQVNREARFESRDGYEATGPRRSSHVHFGRDIFVCDASITDTTSNKPLEALATRVERLAFWDCYPDDMRVELPFFYTAYLAASQAAAGATLISTGSTWSSGSGTSASSLRLPAVDFDKLWFPNLRDLWIVKVGGVNSAWLIDADVEQDAIKYESPLAPRLACSNKVVLSSFSVPPTHHARSQQDARKFRYWVQENVVEMASLSLDEPDTRLVLQEGRCGRSDCHELNRGRPLLVSKVTFMEGRYNPSKGWLRVAPWYGFNGSSSPSTVAASSPDAQDSDDTRNSNARDCSRESMRWIVVERILAISLCWESPHDAGEGSRRHIGAQSPT
ncbi:hypothetical protein NQ176_g3141 [Zarea fungicola]|uniref:Uncharacterized protein n=1 Tax=Zarea fungicola TaxID=93591 RepID=A0ACC1NM84_9HYPO|nr:hypothetical protein NQ176_g3141 [Lecanicillium fungicola]